MATRGASRQKSCNACVLGKRRCDQTRPACNRCVARNVRCVYSGRRPAELRHSPAPLDVDLGSFDLDTASVGPGTYDMSMIDEMSPPDLVSAGLSPGGLFQTLLNDSINQQQLVLPSDLQRQDYVTIVEPSRTREDYAMINPMCEAYEPWHLADPDSKISLTVSAVKSFCTQFATDACTPYLHKTLYKSFMPSSVLKAWTTCSQHASLTTVPANRGMFLRVLHENVSDLHHEAETPGRNASIDRLGRLHALMFYQILRMFDGDITLASQVADDMPLLDSWAMDILTLRDNLDGAVKPGGEAVSPPETWERWVFAECVRRTCIIAFSIATLWRVLARKDDTTSSIGVWAYDHRWTLSSHLWGASDSIEFYRAWKEKPIHVISNFDFAEFFEAGEEGEVDPFAKIFLIWFNADEVKRFIDETVGRTE